MADSEETKRAKHAAYARKWRRDNRERYRESERLRSKARYAADPDRQAAFTAAWRESNPDHARELGRNWYVANKEQHLASSRANYYADPEKQRVRGRAWREANAVTHKANGAAWTRANPDKVRAKSLRRRAKGRATSEDVRIVRETCDGVCSYCLTPGLALSVEHIKPISKGGTNDLTNLTMACQPCNSSKGARSLLEMLLRSKATPLGLTG